MARTKPIVAVKAGRSSAGSRAASSHTGALATSDTVVDALFHQAGVIRTERLEELFDVAALLANQPVPRGRRVAILTNAGGPGILAADACEAHGLVLPVLADATRAELRSFLPAAASVGNPVDMLASAPADHYRRALAAILRDEQVDSVITIFIPPLVTDPADVAAAVADAGRTAGGKPLLGRIHARRRCPAHIGADSVLCLSRISRAGAGARREIRRVAREATGITPSSRQIRSGRDPNHHRPRALTWRRVDDG